MQSDGTAVLRKEHGFLFDVQSVAISVSVKSLVPQCFFFSGNESNKEMQEEPKQQRHLPPRRNLVFASQFPVPVSVLPCPALGGIEMNAAQKNAGLGTPHPCTTNLYMEVNAYGE